MAGAIILLSPSYEVGIHDGKSLARKYNEQVSFFTKGCFDNVGHDSRLTFLAHSHMSLAKQQVLYGDKELSPQAFVDKLIELGMPDDVKVVDLMGCQASYADKVAKILLEKYPNIRINSLEASVVKSSHSSIIHGLNIVNTEVVSLDSQLDLASQNGSIDIIIELLTAGEKPQDHTYLVAKNDEVRGVLMFKEILDKDIDWLKSRVNNIVAPEEKFAGAANDLQSKISVILNTNNSSHPEKMYKITEALKEAVKKVPKDSSLYGSAASLLEDISNKFARVPFAKENELRDVPTASNAMQQSVNTRLNRK